MLLHKAIARTPRIDIHSEPDIRACSGAEKYFLYPFFHPGSYLYMKIMVGNKIVFLYAFVIRVSLILISVPVYMLDYYFRSQRATVYTRVQTDRSGVQVGPTDTRAAPTALCISGRPLVTKSPFSSTRSSWSPILPVGTII